MPDAHLGFLALNWVTMGQILSAPMIIIGAALFYFAYKTNSYK
jgi:phosphatidylglycerol:prolipoprotein diacylglycerol transferase